MFTKEEKEKLQKMNELFGEVEDIFDTFSPETKEYILNYHNENSSLPHCIRWGITGTDELLREETVLDIGTAFTVKTKLEYSKGFVPKGSKAVLIAITYDEIHDEDEKPYHVDFEKFIAYEEEDESDGTCDVLSYSELKKYLEII